MGRCEHVTSYTNGSRATGPSSSVTSISSPPLSSAALCFPGVLTERQILRVLNDALFQILSRSLEHRRDSRVLVQNVLEVNGIIEAFSDCVGSI
jgi:hypothetical protein